jgi:hypothetical protein
MKPFRSGGAISGSVVKNPVDDRALTSFSGHPITCVRGVHDVEDDTRRDSDLRIFGKPRLEGVLSDTKRVRKSELQVATLTIE